MAELRNAEDWWKEAARVAPSIDEYCDTFSSLKTILRKARTQLPKSVIALMEENLAFNVRQLIQHCIETKDKRLLALFNTIWNDAPDSPKIHQWPNWHDFCDLCSEGPDCLRETNNATES